MRMLHLSAIACGLLCGATTFAAAPGMPQVIVAPVAKLLVPQGFDSNDRVEIVARGTFENSCMRVGQASQEVDVENKVIRVKVLSYDYSKLDVMCAQMETPFIQSVNVGVLPSGTYRVELEGNTTVASTVRVVEAKTASPDDYMYAPVSNVSVEHNVRGDVQTVELRGKYPRMLVGCMKIDEVRVTESPREVLVVQPIAHVEKDAAKCPKALDFKVLKRLQKPFVGDAGTGVAHVRVLNGNSLNTYVDVNAY